MMAKPPRMHDDYSTPARRSTPLIQAALALLVAGTLVAFSALAFRTGFADDRGEAVTASDIGRAGGAVVLPALGPSTDREAPRRPADARIAITGATNEPVVLGTRVDDVGVRTADGLRGDDRGQGLGHEKARGRGHHRDDDNGNHDGDGSGPDDDTAAREEDDDGDDHSDEADDRDDDDGSDASYGSGSGSGRSGRSGPRRRGSGGHTGSSN